ncbi:MAG: HAMP domain-containing sensor histidine kinase [Desulfurivibrionaceae bacterium]|nr:HAMP domain-containing sensor histidine kinase [Desulfobulbales bacterium]MDT8334255.1 HAMP domain-containing sensor histidine kinase [Desulfurivibrionaceae bacterium]
MAKPEKAASDLHYIHQRVRKKEADYQTYRFTRRQNDILKTFFDLAQEFDSLQDFYRICVAVPNLYLDLQVRLYLLDINTDRFELVCDSLKGLLPEPSPAPPYLEPRKSPYEHGDSYLVPIARKHYDSEDTPVRFLQGRLLGMLEVSPQGEMTAADYFFFGKYTNRIAHNLHNRRLVQQNIRHLEFINNLVMDIEHNVIIPNMYFRHLFNQLRKNLDRLAGLVEELPPAGEPPPAGQNVRTRLLELQAEFAENHRQLLDHHVNTSLFLESLFRRDHFKEGHLVLKTRLCSVGSEIIRPQLENYQKRFELYGIEVEHPTGMEVEIYLTVDIGLLSQVYANLFSNGVKYAEEITRKDGSRRKALAYGWEFYPDFFGPGMSGIKFNVFTTGRHLRQAELSRIFEDGFRGANASGSSGTGHGLSFIKQVVEIHGGRVGCEPVEEGNNFFFVLPVPPPLATVEAANPDHA